MPFITALNSCYYECDHLLDVGPKPPDDYIPLYKSDALMAEQIHDDIEIKRPPDMTPKEKAVQSMKQEQARIDTIKPIIETVKSVLDDRPKESMDLQRVGEGVSEKDINQVTKDIMKNRTKSIIQKITQKEKNKSKKLGTGKTGGGVKEL